MGNGNFWTGVAFGALTGAAIGAAATSGSRFGYYSGYGAGFGSYTGNSIHYYSSFGRFNGMYTGSGIGYGRLGWGLNSTILGPDCFNSFYANPLTVASIPNLALYI